MQYMLSQAKAFLLPDYVKSISILNKMLRYIQNLRYIGTTWLNKIILVPSHQSWAGYFFGRIPDIWLIFNAEYKVSCRISGQRSISGKLPDIWHQLAGYAVSRWFQYPVSSRILKMAGYPAQPQSICRYVHYICNKRLTLK